jgi:hypothetical protein
MPDTCTSCSTPGTAAGNAGLGAAIGAGAGLVGSLLVLLHAIDQQAQSGYAVGKQSR